MMKGDAMPDRELVMKGVLHLRADGRTDDEDQSRSVKREKEECVRENNKV